MAENEISFVATPTMEDFMLSEAYVRLLAGPIGSGKSVCCVHELLRWATDQKPNRQGIRKTRFLICRNTNDQLRSTTLKTVFDWLPPSLAGSWVVTDKTFYIRFGLPDGTSVETDWMAIALDTPDDVRKALSLEATGLWGNESRELHPDVVDGLLMRVNRYPSMKDGGPTRPGAIFDTNYPEMGGWWYEHMLDPPNNWEVFTQPPAVLPVADWQAKYGAGRFHWRRAAVDITAESLTSGIVKAEATREGLRKPVSLVAKDGDQDVYVVDHEADNFNNLNPSYYPNTLEGKTKEFINVYLRCMFGESKEGRPVFEGFRRDFHVAQSALGPSDAADGVLTPINDPNRPLLIGMDFGLTPACTISQLDVRGRLLTFAELTSSNMGIYRFIHEKLNPLLADRFPNMPVLVIGDPSGVQRAQTDERTVFEVLEQEGFNVVPAPTNVLGQRISAVEQFLSRVVDGRPAHLIDPTCKTLIAGFAGGYRYRMKKTGEIEAKPDKNHYSHLMDGHQYTCVYVAQGGHLHGGFRRQTGVRREVQNTGMRGWI